MSSKQLIFFIIVGITAIVFMWFTRVVPIDDVHVVGSSTVFPFVSSVAESFHRDTHKKTPVVESNGTAGGIKIFCTAKGPNAPDILDASRVIYPSEQVLCKKNGIEDLQGFRIGYDGIIFANSKATTAIYSFTPQDFYMALAKNVTVKGKIISNPYHKWNEINPALPDSKIKVYGPPSTSGTRDVFIDNMIAKVCLYQPEVIKAYPNREQRNRECNQLRQDGVYLEIGENDNLAIQKLQNDPNAFAIFGYSYLDQNRNIVKPHLINGIEPTPSTIVTEVYPLGRPLFVYFKRSSLAKKPEIKAFLKYLLHDETIGSSGYLVEKGLIPLTDKERVETQKGMELILE